MEKNITAGELYMDPYPTILYIQPLVRFALLMPHFNIFSLNFTIILDERGVFQYPTLMSVGY